MDEVPSEILTCEELIQRYFDKGFNYQKIPSFLSRYHGIEMSLRTLNTKLRDLGLKRKDIDYTTFAVVFGKNWTVLVALVATVLSGTG